MSCPLIRGHGNFGSIDADPPAAMRYTECRLDVSLKIFFYQLLWGSFFTQDISTLYSI